jgi:hypothetical protein
MDVRPALVADRQATILAQPRQRALHAPALPPQPCAARPTLARDAHLDTAPTHGKSTAREVVRLVRRPLVRALAGAPPRPLEGPDAVEQRRQDAASGVVGCGEDDSEREALPVDHQMALAARFAALRRMRPGFRAPLVAGAKALSTLARRQAIVSAAPQRSKSAGCRRSHTPACGHARRRRQQVTPRPQPSSWGNSSQGGPLLSTQMMPVTAARSGTRGRPPLGLGGAGGNSGASVSHTGSLPNGLLIRPGHAARAMPGF